MNESHVYYRRGGPDCLDEDDMTLPLYDTPEKVSCGVASGAIWEHLKLAMEDGDFGEVYHGHDDRTEHADTYRIEKENGLLKVEVWKRQKVEFIV